MMPGPTLSKQVLIMCLLPVWFVVIVVLGQAVADFHDQAFFAKVRIDLAILNQQQGGGQVDEKLPAYFFRPNDEKNLNGQVVTSDDVGFKGAKNLRVVLLKGGDIIKEAKPTDAKGRFVWKGVTPGVYAMVASGRNGFLAYGVEFPEVDDVATRVIPRQQELHHHVSVSNTELTDAKAHDQPQNESDNVANLNNQAETQIEAQDELQTQALAIPPKFGKLASIIDSLPRDAGRQVADNAKFSVYESFKLAEGFTYSLNDDGTFSGRVLIPSIDGKIPLPTPLSDMNIYLLQRNEMKYVTQVQDNGDFFINHPIAPGVYGLVAAGKDGFAAVSVNLVPADSQLSPNQHPRTDEKYVSLVTERAPASFCIPIIVDRENLKYCRDTIIELNELDANEIEETAAIRDTNGILPRSRADTVARTGYIPLAQAEMFPRGLRTAGLAGADRAGLRGVAALGLAAAIVVPTTVDPLPPVSPFEP